MGTITQEKNIKDCKYSVTQFTFRKSAKVFAFLLRIGLPTFIQGLLSMQSIRFNEEAEISADDAVNAVIRLLDNLSDENIDKLLNEMFALTFIDGKELLPVMDTKFQGDFRLAAEVLLFSIEVNYGNFLGVNLFQKLAEKFQAVRVTTD